MIFLYFFLKYLKLDFDNLALIQPSFINSDPLLILSCNMYISPSLILPKSLSGSLLSNHFIIDVGLFVFRLILCSAKYLNLPILG